MIIDSHAHYSHFGFENVYKYIQYEDGKYSLMQSNRADMLLNFREFGIQLCIEPTARYSQIEHQLQVVEQYRPYLRLALGVHPKYCTDAAWEDRKRLRELVFSNELIAIGETGLDYSNPPPLRKNYQKMWFFYQIRLADELNLPLILHFRDAYQDGIALLTRHRQMLHGGVAHCYNENVQIALQLIDLGFAIGIGGKLLSETEEGFRLQETVKHIPLESILIETDAPFVKPDYTIDNCSKSQRGKARNSSMVLPAVIDKIAELQGKDRTLVEETIYRNTLRVFRIEQ